MRFDSSKRFRLYIAPVKPGGRGHMTMGQYAFREHAERDCPLVQVCYPGRKVTVESF